MSKFIFPLQTSTIDGKYHNYYGEFSEASLLKDGNYKLGISECHSGLFHLEGLSQKKNSCCQTPANYMSAPLSARVKSN